MVVNRFVLLDVASKGIIHGFLSLAEIAES